MSGASSPVQKMAALKVRDKPKPPQAPRSAFICFADFQKNLLDATQQPQKANVLKQRATEWKKLSDRERAHWDEVARNDKVRFVCEKEQYKGEWVVPKRRAKKHPGAPKRPMSAFLNYSRSRRGTAKEENPELSNTDVSRLLGEMWRNASPLERSPYVEQEGKERAVYKDQTKVWRGKQAKEDVASRSSHRMVHQTQRLSMEGNSFDPFMRVHSVEEAIQKADRSFASFAAPEDLDSDLVRRSQPDGLNAKAYRSFRSYENDVQVYRPHAEVRHPAPYPFRPYPTMGDRAHAPVNYSPAPLPEEGRPHHEGQETERYPTTSRYFDRPRHSPYGFYQYP